MVDLYIHQKRLAVWATKPRTQAYFQGSRWCSYNWPILRVRSKRRDSVVAVTIFCFICSKMADNYHITYPVSVAEFFEVIKNQIILLVYLFQCQLLPFLISYTGTSGQLELQYVQTWRADWRAATTVHRIPLVQTPSVVGGVQGQWRRCLRGYC